MVTYEDIDKLLSSRASDGSVLSLYVRVPQEELSLPELPALATDLITAAAAATPGVLRDEDARQARLAVASHAREWLGSALGIFVSGQLGLLDVIPFPGQFAERAVLAARPHVRPLLAALQRHPNHRIVIIDHQHAWLLAVTAARIEVVARIAADMVPSGGYGGWYLEPSHGLERVTERSGHLYQEAAAILGRQARDAGPQPIVIGGYADSITHLLALLPSAIISDYAGGFAADPHLLTTARAGELAALVIAHWAEWRERHLTSAIMTPAPGIQAVTGVEECLAAVNSDAADLLLIPDDLIVPGFVCERCDVLSRGSDECCDWGAASRRVPDLLEEMALRTIRAGGQVVSSRALSGTVAARLR